MFFAAGAAHASQELLGAARLEIGNRGGLIDDSAWSFLWVVDAPMFEPRPTTAAGPRCTTRSPPRSRSGPTSSTAEPGGAIADAYDMVCNGFEIGGGSIRIHRQAMQQAVFDVIGLTQEEARSQFGFLLDAFKYGPPPHGGMAFGWDRIIMLLAGADSIRDVIAFPKAASGGDPLTGAPDADHGGAAQGGRRRRGPRPAAEAFLIAPRSWLHNDRPWPPPPQPPPPHPPQRRLLRVPPSSARCLFHAPTLSFRRHLPWHPLQPSGSGRRAGRGQRRTRVLPVIRAAASEAR